MKVLVTVKDVAVVDDAFTIEDGTVPEEFLSYELNEWDEYALEAAVRLAEDYDDIEVVTATVGPERAEETIRSALAKEADRAVRVWDDGVGGVSDLDPSTTAALLAPIIEDEQPELVLTGVQAGDVARGATGVALAEQVGYQWAAVVNHLDLDRESGIVAVHRELEGGVAELAEIDLPAVLTVQTGINDPRYASLRGIRAAQRKELAVRHLADLGLDESVLDSPIERVDMTEPESESDATLFEGDASETAGQLADVLHEQGVGGT